MFKAFVLVLYEHLRDNGSASNKIEYGNCTVFPWQSLRAWYDVIVTLVSNSRSAVWDVHQARHGVMTDSSLLADTETNITSCFQQGCTLIAQTQRSLFCLFTSLGWSHRCTRLAKNSAFETPTRPVTSLPLSQPICLQPCFYPPFLLLSTPTNIIHY